VFDRYFWCRNNLVLLNIGLHWFLDSSQQFPKGEKILQVVI
jgi:hypothetical protein